MACRWTRQRKETGQKERDVQRAGSQASQPPHARCSYVWSAHGHTPLHPRDGQLLQQTSDLLALSLALDAGRCIRALHVAGMPMEA